MSTQAKKNVIREASSGLFSKAFSTFRVGRGGGLVVDRSLLHESQEFKRQLKALGGIQLPPKKVK